MSNKKLSSKYSSIYLLKKLFSHLSTKRKKQLCLLVVIMVLSSVAELFSVASLLPLLMAIIEPNRILNISLFQNIFQILNINDPSLLIYPATLFFLITIVIAAIIRILGLWCNNRLAAAIGSDIGIKAFQNSLYQNYEVHINRNSTEVVNVAFTQVNRVVQVVDSFLRLMTSVFIAVGLLIPLFIVNFYLSVLLFFIFGLAYLSLAKFLKNKTLKNSQYMVTANQKILKIINESLSSIRDIIISERQKYFSSEYAVIDRRSRVVYAQNNFFASSPRFILETVGIILMTLITIYLSANSEKPRLVIPIIGSIALGIQRFLPALQQIYAAWSIIRINSAPLDSVIRLLDQEIKVPNDYREIKRNTFKKGFIEFKDISYKYLSSETTSINKLNFKIGYGEKIGIIGRTGSGKSTFVDILMGLLKPSKGKLLINGVDINNPKNIVSLIEWRRSISHVPQNINLIDDTFKNNIAFGILENKIDMKFVKECAERAKISSFIEKKLNGYETLIGEEGVNLSGGQRQRLGIARALYLRSNVIVFDEATSALDTHTEREVINSIFKNNSVTLIIIAHRLETLRNCDRIIQLENGLITKIGPPDLLINENE